MRGSLFIIAGGINVFVTEYWKGARPVPQRNAHAAILAKESGSLEVTSR